MTFDQIVTLCVLIGAFALFVTEIVPLGVTGLLIIASLGLTGVLDAGEATRAFASPAVVLVASLYVVSASLVRTGVIAAIEERMLRFGGKTEARLLIVSTAATALVSTVLNNTSVVVLMLPILLGAARRLDVPPSRLLMPVSFAAILGGTMTLIGTSTNILVADLASRDFTIEFFDFLPVGAGFAAVGLFYLWFVGRRMLPSRPTVSSVTRGRGFEYVTELRVPDSGPVVGTTAVQLARRAGADIRVLQLIRGEEVLDRFSPETVLEPGDVVVLRASPKAIVALRRDLRLETLPGATEDADLVAHETTFAEIVITPVSEHIGRTLSQIGLYRTLGVLAVALQRRGAHLRRGIVDLPLKVGDVILVQGDPERIERLRLHAGMILLVGVEEEVALRRRAPCAAAVLLLFIALGASGIVSLPLLGVAAAAATLATGCVTLQRAIREVNWNVLGLLAGAVTLGLALQTTGLADEAARLVVGVTRKFGAHVVLCAIYLLTSIATEIVSNSGAAAVMVPIAIATAREIHAAPQPFVFAVAFAASASFTTPVGYQTNTFILGPGGYRFRDFFKVGLPLQIVLWAYATLAIPVFFPF